MDILLTNHRLHTLGGTEQWSKTMYRTLTMMGHNVRVRTFFNDDIPHGFQIDDGRVYDLALINHHDPQYIKANFKIYTSHGVRPSPEIPKPGADIYVSVSEEVKNYHKLGGPVIRNPIDLAEFIPISSVKRFPETILFISNNPPDVREKIRLSFSGYNVIFLGGKYRKPSKPFIEMADIVISLGRGVYEAMAMNRNVLVYDYNGAEGIITAESYYDFRTHNCSGRKYHQHLSPDKLRTMVLENYQSELNHRSIIEKEHDSVKIAYQYLSLYKQFITS